MKKTDIQTYSISKKNEIIVGVSKIKNQLGERMKDDVIDRQRFSYKKY